MSPDQTDGRTIARTWEDIQRTLLELQDIDPHFGIKFRWLQWHIQEPGVVRYPVEPSSLLAPAELLRAV
jgi:hypothetical protein